MFEFIPKRHVLNLVGFSATTISIALQTNVSLTIIYMVQPDNKDYSKALQFNECSASQNGSNEIAVDRESLEWSPDMQGIAISAQFLAMILAFIPGGRMAEKYGAKRTMVTTMFIASLATAVSPAAAKISVYVFIFCRMIVGMGSAPVFPVLVLFISRWIPDCEQSATSSFMLAGYGTGAFVVYLVGGELCASDFFGHWPSVFYLSAGWGFIWCLWSIFVISDFPETHPNITDIEKQYIRENISRPSKKLSTVPWRAISTSIPVWSMVIAAFGQYWLLAFSITSHTIYMGTILNLESNKNGYLTCLPNLLRAVTAFAAGCVIDCVRRRKDIPRVYIRKSATAVNSLVSCLGFVGVLFSGCNPLLNTLFFIVASICGDFTTFGIGMVPNDMAPGIGGTLTGILSCIGSIPYVVLPLLIGFITKNEQSRTQWSYIYYCTIAVTLSTTAIYLILGSSDPQPWAEEEKDSSVTDGHKRRGNKENGYQESGCNIQRC